MRLLWCQRQPGSLAGLGQLSIVPSTPYLLPEPMLAKGPPVPGSVMEYQD